MAGCEPRVGLTHQLLIAASDRAHASGSLDGDGPTAAMTAVIAMIAQRRPSAAQREHPPDAYGGLTRFWPVASSQRESYGEWSGIGGVRGRGICYR